MTFFPSVRYPSYWLRRWPKSVDSRNSLKTSSLFPSSSSAHPSLRRRLRVRSYSFLDRVSIQLERLGLSSMGTTFISRFNIYSHCCRSPFEPSLQNTDLSGDEQTGQRQCKGRRI